MTSWHVVLRAHNSFIFALIPQTKMLMPLSFGQQQCWTSFFLARCKWVIFKANLAATISTYWWGPYFLDNFKRSCRRNASWVSTVVNKFVRYQELLVDPLFWQHNTRINVTSINCVPKMKIIYLCVTRIQFFNRSCFYKRGLQNHNMWHFEIRKILWKFQ